ncbi:MAG: ABC transporter substrate-binding protein [Kineosporiaceae bacterium]
MTTAAALAAVMTVAACSGGGDAEEGAADESPAEDTAEAPQGGELSVFLTNPENLAPPSNVTESEGGEVIRALYAPLVQFDFEQAEPLFGDDAPDAVAENLETEDNQTFTITLKEGWTFHNGDPVTAQSYVDAWNYGAVGTNANTGAEFFAEIEGYADLQCSGEPTEENPCPTPPTAEELSGLEVIDDQTFEITLSAPNRVFALVLGYSAFFPVPEAFFDDPEAFEAAPIGNGPFQVDEEGWVQDQQIRVERWDDYPGTQPNVDAVEFRIYDSIDSAYNDALAGNLDVMGDIPAASLATAEQDFPNYFDEPSDSIQFIGFPLYDERFQDPNLRRAFSLAVDRQAITEAVRPDWAPLNGFVPETVASGLGDECGGNCPPTADPEQARQLLEEAGGWEGPLVLWFNQGGDHEGWMEAVSNQLRENLGIEDIQFQSLQFAEYLPLLDGQQVTGPWRLGWLPDYPSAKTYLESLHASPEAGGSSNNSGYANPEFDALLAEAKAAEDAESSIAAFEQAQELLNEDMPIMPMFVARNIGIAGERITNFELDWQGNVDLYQVAVTEE